MTQTGHIQQIIYRALQLKLTKGAAEQLATNAVTLYGQGRQQGYNRITCNMASTLGHHLSSMKMVGHLELAICIWSKGVLAVLVPTNPAEQTDAWYTNIPVLLI